MKIITRTDAALSGLKRYFTGELCKHGHRAERTVCDHACVECGRLKSANPNTRLLRREYMAAHQRRYRKKHPDRVSATQCKRQHKNTALARKRRAANPEPHRAALRKSFQKHKAKRMGEMKVWRKNHKAAVALYMRAAKVMRRAAEGRFDSSDIVRMLVEQNYTCKACPADITTCYHVDHIVPLSRGGTHWPSNLQLLCGPCNRSKGAKTMAEWLSWKASLQRRPSAQPPPAGLQS